MTKDDIKELYSMADILARYGLQPSRASFISCPFHAGDRTPSLKVYEKDFHCHACGAHGDIFDFVQRMEDLTFTEAFRVLGGTSDTSKVRSRLYRANLQKERVLKEQREHRFLSWQKSRLHQVCRLLRLLDELLLQYQPGTNEWSAAVEIKIVNDYKYWVLTRGTRVEREEMRRQDE